MMEGRIVLVKDATEEQMKAIIEEAQKLKLDGKDGLFGWMNRESLDYAVRLVKDSSAKVYRDGILAGAGAALLGVGVGKLVTYGMEHKSRKRVIIKEET